MSARQHQPEDATLDSAALRFLDALIEGCQIIDFDWRYVYLNDAAARQGRKPRELLLGRTMMEAYPGIEDTAMFALLRACMNERQAQQVENEFKYPDGSSAWFELRIEPVPQGVFILSVDISERKRAEMALRRLSTAIDQSAEAIFITDVTGNIVYVNPAFERTTGYSRDEVIGGNPRILRSGKQEEEFYREMWSTISSGRTWRGRVVNRRKDGRLITEDTTISPVVDANGAIVNYVCVKRDVTRELQLERQFQHAQKMEAVGQLAGGVAHDFNNLLSLVVGYTDVLLDSIPVNDPMRADVLEIQKAGARATALTRQLLALSRNQPLETEVVDVNEVVAGLEGMLRRVLGEDIALEARLHPQLSRIRLDTGQLEQIVMNLAINSRDAMPHGGKLTIDTSNVELDAEYSSRHFAVSPGSYVMLAISDTGVGMSEDTQAHVFEPFFTTKEAGRGTGLGLATVYGIVKQGGGSIWVYSEEGSGTTFKIYFPVHRGEPPERAAEPAVTAAPRAGETILLVEDDAGVRRITERLLVSSGYRVICASDGNEALRICEENADGLAMMLTDVMMPGMSGVDLARRATAACPELRVLFMSGYAENAVIQMGELGSRARFLSKPFTANELSRKIREVLDEGA